MNAPSKVEAGKPGVYQAIAAIQGELAKTGISKPYLSLIETGRVPNPPSDEKLRRLEQARRG